METKALLAVRTKSTNGQLNEGINEGRTGKTAGRPCFPLTSGGGTGIRTLDRLLTYAGFQDRCIQPLCHPSAA